DEQHICFLDTILPQLAAEGIHLLRPEEISREQEQFLEDYFRKTLYPIVTPLAIDPGHPFPYLANRSLVWFYLCMRRIPHPCRTRNFLSFIFRLKLFGGSFSFRARKTNTHSCCWKMSSGSICRVSIMVLTFSLRTPFGLRGTLNSAS